MIHRPVISPLFPYTTLFRSNYDSFTYNLVQYLGELGATSDVVRNDSIPVEEVGRRARDRKSTRLNSSHLGISYAVFCLKKKKKTSRSRVEQTKRNVMS